jgi:hypothetical protein
VTAAVLLTGTTVGVLLTLPIWTGARRPSFAGAVLSVHAGLVAVVGVVTAAAAARTWQVVGRAPSEHVAGLIQVSRTDGDGSMFALIVLALAFGTCFAVVALALGARFATSDDAAERIVACAVLALEICVGGYAVARLLGGSHGVAVVALAVQLPLAMVAMVACWPPVEDLVEQVEHPA